MIPYLTPKNTLYAASVLGLLGSTCFANIAYAATFYTADNSNATSSTVGLSTSYLGSGILSNPAANLAPGGNNYKFAAVQFTAKEDGTYVFGQTSAPVDTVMILYNGVYAPSNPGTGALVGNDDTGQDAHRNALGDPTVTTMCGNQSWCPQITYNVVKGVTYTLFVSVYSPSRSSDFDLPFDFYSTGSVVFGQYTGRSPIDTMQPTYVSSALGVDVDPVFVGGTLRMDENNTTYIEDFTLSDMATNTIDQNGNDVKFSGVFSDAVAGENGNIIIKSTQAGGSVTFTGVNTYTGSTTLKSGGVLSVSQDANLGDSAAKIIFDGGSLHTTDNVQSNRNITLASTGTVNVAAGTSLAVAGVIDGAGSWSKEGTGTLVLNGTSVNTGLTDIKAGQLIVGSNATLASTAQLGGNVYVGNAATLAGHGTITGHVTAKSGGTVAPGSSIGSLKVGGITFENGSTYLLDAYADGTSDLITSNTNATIQSGSKLAVLAGVGTWNENTTYTIIDSNSGVDNTFEHMSTDLAFLTPSQLIDGNKLLLVLTRNDKSLGNTGGSQNQSGTGSGVNSLGPDHPLYDTIVSMNTAQANAAYDNLGGEIYGSVHSAVLTNNRHARNAVNQHLEIETNTGVTGTTIDNGKGLWVHTWAHDGRIKGDRNAVQLDNKGWGVLAGVDVFNNEATTVGFALGYEQSSLDIKGNRNSNADVDTFHLMAYGRTSVGPIDIKGGVGYSHLSVNSTRNIAVGNHLSENKADYNGGVVQIFAQGSHTFNLNEKATLTPYVNLSYQSVRTGSFTEKSGATLSPTLLHQNSSSNHMATSTLGARGTINIGTQGSSLYADIGWQHSFGDTTPEVSLNFIGGRPFNTRGAEVNKNAVQIGLGANIQMESNITLNVGYEGLFGNESRDHAAKVRLDYKF